MSSADQAVPSPMAETAPRRGVESSNIKARYRADRRFQIYGITAIVVALGMLGTLLTTIIGTGYTAFVQTHVAIQVPLPAEQISRDNPADANYRKIVFDAWYAMFPDVDSPTEQRALREMLSAGAPYIVRDRVESDPDLIGTTLTLDVPVTDRIDQLHKGEIDRSLPPERRIVTDQQIAWYDQMIKAGMISLPFNWRLFTEADSRYPELAGLWGAIVGSFYALTVCFLLSFPIGIAAAIYLEEFAVKNRVTEIIEININNLAAVPSIVFGLLGLAVFIQTFGLPRSAPLVGGMTLALMTLPTIIIAARASLKAVPPSIREAALGVGASKQQAVLHHVLPLSMPGMMTGTIIGLAQALGETAPLLLIGMNAFITSAPEGITSAATALPTQIYIWADSPERGFTARTSAAIIVLLGFLICMNGLAVYMRRRLERRW